MFRGKKYQESAKQIDKATLYDPKEGLELICKTASAKFDETVELHVRLGVDGRHADQQVRGAVVLPNGTGKTVRVLVFAKGDKANEALAAGADFVGAEDMVAKIQGGWFDFDVCVATPDMMGMVGRLGRVLGPKGLMPNPKSGTVSMDVTRAINDIKAGKVEYRVDKTAIIHCPVGKASFDEVKLQENLRIFDVADVGCLSAEEKETLARVREAYEARMPIGCTGCGYCQPCPQGVKIPDIFRAYDKAAMFDDPASFRAFYAQEARPDCVGCLACEAACPQHFAVPIHERIQAIAAQMRA